MHMWSHYSSACASITPTKRVASEVKHSFGCPHTRCDAPTQNMFIHSHIEPVFPHTFTHREGNREEEEHWLRFFAFLCICECLECTLNTYKHQMRTVLVCLWKLRALGKLLRFVNVAFLAATIAVAQPVYQSLAREQHPARWPRSDTLDCWVYHWERFPIQSQPLPSPFSTKTKTGDAFRGPLRV